MPALRDRPEDVPLLIAHFLNGRIHPRQGKPYQITREAAEVCSEYRWPGNVRELETAIEHACAKAQDGTIQCSDLPRPLHQLSPDTTANSVPQSLASAREATPYRMTPRPKPNEAVQENGNGVAQLDLPELVPLTKFLRDQEVAYLQRILGEVGGSKERAAELLGVSLATIYRKLSEPDGALGESEGVPAGLAGVPNGTPPV